MTDEHDPMQAAADRLREDLAFAAPELWALHFRRRLEEVVDYVAPLDAAWHEAKEAAGEGALISLNERDTTVEASAKIGITSIGFGYGPTPERALLALVAHIEKSKAGGG